MKQLLIATNLTQRSHYALKRALQLANQFGAALEILHVMEEAWLEELTSRQQDTAARAIAEEVKHLTGEPPGNVHINVIVGWDYIEILKRAGEISADLVVLGIHRHNTRDLFMGTTAERVVRNATVPVLVVKSDTEGPYRSILAATDFSPASLSALSCAGTLCPGSSIRLCHSTAQSKLSSLLPGRKQTAEQVETNVRSEASNALGLAGDDQARLAIVVDAEPIRALLESTISKQTPELIVLGTNGRGGLAQAVIGSVAADVLANAPTDVLVSK